MYVCSREESPRANINKRTSHPTWFEYSVATFVPIPLNYVTIPIYIATHKNPIRVLAQWWFVYSRAMSCNSPGNMDYGTETAQISDGNRSSDAAVNLITKANSLEESIIRTLNEKYKDFSVEDEEDDINGCERRGGLPLCEWDATKCRAPRRSHSWLCCPTIYGPSELVEENKRTVFKADVIESPPKLNPHNHSVQLQTTALSTMRSEVVELSQRLQRSEHGRHVLEQQLRETLQERERTHRQLESMAATNESRITEMHCIIVELSKKLKTKEDNVIAEEPEGSGEKTKYQTKAKHL